MNELFIRPSLSDVGVKALLLEVDRADETTQRLYAARILNCVTATP